MAKPAPNHPAIEDILETVSAVIGQPRSQAFPNNTCVVCKGEAKDFKNEISSKEYRISGMCQTCQDKIFDSPVPSPI